MKDEGETCEYEEDSEKATLSEDFGHHLASIASYLVSKTPLVRTLIAIAIAIQT